MKHQNRKDPCTSQYLNDPHHSINYNSNSSSVILDDCNFHECVLLDEFDQHRVLRFIPPNGEFIILNYRLTNYHPPFRIYPTIDEINIYKFEI